MSKWEWDKYFLALGSGICGKYGLGNGIGTPPSGSSDKETAMKEKCGSKILGVKV